MKIQFAFESSKPLPLYRSLSAVMAKQHACVHRTFQTASSFVIEAKGEQTELESLAQYVAQVFPVSVFLTKAGIQPIENWSAQKDEALIDNAPLTLAYCPHCSAKFAKLNHANFGQTELPCEWCNGHTQDLIDTWDVQKTLTTLLDKETVQITLHGQTVCLSLPKSTQKSTDVMITHSTVIKRHFMASDTQLLGLSAIEKPAMILVPTEANTQVATQTPMRVFFPQTRKALVLSEQLRLKGIDWIFVESMDANLSLFEVVRFGEMWQPVRFPIRHTGELYNWPEPLRDSTSANQRYADVQNNTIHYGSLPHAKQTLIDKWQAVAQLHALKAQNKIGRHHCSVVQLSQVHGCECLTLGALNDQHTLFHFSDIPNTGEAIFDAMVGGGYQVVIEKYIARWPDRMRILVEKHWQDNVKGIAQVWRVCAILLGLGEETSQLQTAAMRYQGHNGPGIDYSIENGDLQWVKTLGSVMSFLLADDAQPNKIAYGCYDSFADNLATWLDDQQAAVNLGDVLLCGDEFANPLLIERVRLRLEKNIPLKTLTDFGLSDFSAAIGALYLPQRQINESCV